MRPGKHVRKPLPGFSPQKSLRAIAPCCALIFDHVNCAFRTREKWPEPFSGVGMHQKYWGGDAAPPRLNWQGGPACPPQYSPRLRTRPRRSLCFSLATPSTIQSLIACLLCWPLKRPVMKRALLSFVMAWCSPMSFLRKRPFMRSMAAWFQNWRRGNICAICSR